MPKVSSKHSKPADKSPKSAKASTSTTKTQSSNGTPRQLETTDRPVVYPTLKINGVEIPRDKLRISCERAKKLLKWESQADYYNRLREEDPKITIDDATFGNTAGEGYLLKDEEDTKIQCFNNLGNRPFIESWARALAQDILNRHWKFNCEPIIISKTARVLSGQHRLIALVLAVQMWNGANKDHWHELWPEEPYIEALVIQGAEEDPETVATLDNVRVRTLSDIFYTSSDMFSWISPLKGTEREECSRMLEKGVRTLWNRSKRKGTYRDAYEKYLTPSEAKEFVERHPKIMDCIQHIFTINKDRVLSKMKLSPGACAAALYFMGSCGSDFDDYYNATVAQEKLLSWDDWGTACQFWTDLATNKAKVAAVKEAIAKLYDADEDDGGGSAREIEKTIVLAKAWAQYKDGIAIVTEEIMPEMTEDEDGVPHLTDTSVFGGIDNGDGKERFQPVTEQEIEQRKQQIQDQRRKAMEDNIRKHNKKTRGASDERE